ncbi:MAG: class I tRNA ligase family protein [Patescibacteria group bacterium]
MPAVDFGKLEEKILAFWEEHKIFEKSLELRGGKRKKTFVFFEGPPTANGRTHVGHFLTRIFKDVYGRYKTMRGYYVLRKAGWDTHGLPVELEVEKELGFKSKKDIEAYGVAAFNKKCRENVWKYKKEWEVMTRRMGFWVDTEHPYVTYANPYIESLWNIIKTVADKKLLYLAHRVVPYCTRCGTGLSTHELGQPGAYKTVTDTSVYIKFKLKSGQKIGEHTVPSNAFVLAWTTTPWTLPGNVALAVGKDIEYVISTQEINNKKETLILSKDLYERPTAGFLPEPDISFSLPEYVKGVDLVGLEYEPLFDVPALKSETSYKIYPADFVTTTDGTGVVHTAVMYGEDDYNLGNALGLPKVHTVDEAGKFFGVSEELNGKYVKAGKTEETIIKSLEARGLLLKTEAYEHEYPHCWRCDTPLLYYAKSSWFIKMSAVNEQILKANSTINWFPDHIKEGRFGQWLKEGKDWAFSRERYWGTPLPVWKCVKCSAYHVIGSMEDLKKEAVSQSGNNYFLMRHDLSGRDENGKMLVSSRRETDTYHLTEAGQKHAQETLKRLKRKLNIDVIYASPFLRTKETAEIAGQVFHLPVVEDERLSEIRHGIECEGKSHQQCVLDRERRSFDTVEDGSETLNMVRERVMTFMREVDGQYRNKNILVVSHGDPIWVLEKMADGKSEAEVVAEHESNQGWMPQIGEIKKIEWPALPRNERGELDLHKPYVDEVTFQCDQCGAQMHRVPELCDVWFDSGSMPFAQWHWPFENQKLFQSQYPADFIVEAVDQTRGWFYTLLAVATLMDRPAPFKNVIVLGLTLDPKGMKMSKSKGNVMYSGEAMDAAGVDAARWRMFVMSSPEDNKVISAQDFQDTLNGFLSTLQNCLRFYELYTQTNQSPSGDVQPNILDRWLSSRLHNVIQGVTESLENYNPTGAARTLEQFVVEDFSNWWLRRSRKRPEALTLLRQALLHISKLVAPFIPFTAEDMFARLNGPEAVGQESVHLADWPKAEKKFINAKLEETMIRVREIVAAGLAIRKEKQIKVRQPLASIILPDKKLDAGLEALIKDELNVKGVVYKKGVELSLDMSMSPELIAEGYAREAMRQIQDLRKDAGYRFDDKAYCQWFTEDSELSEALLKWGDDIKRDTSLSEFVKLILDDKRAYDIEKEFEIVPGKKIWVGIKK